MSPLQWFQTGVGALTAMVEGAKVARDAFHGKVDSHVAREKIDSIHARGAVNRAKRAQFRVPRAKE